MSKSGGGRIISVDLIDAVRLSLKVGDTIPCVIVQTESLLLSTLDCGCDGGQLSGAPASVPSLQ